MIACIELNTSKGPMRLHCPYPKGTMFWNNIEDVQISDIAVHFVNEDELEE